MTSIAQTFHCANCQSKLSNQSDACPRCGSTDQIQHLQINEEWGLELHDCLDAKLKDPALKSKDKLRVHVKAGDDLRKSDGKWMKKERLIDRDNDKYKESVIDPSTGEVVHYCEELLSQHIEHGTAKKNSN